jgi:hypothetical protein
MLFGLLYLMRRRRKSGKLVITFIELKTMALNMGFIIGELKEGRPVQLKSTAVEGDMKTLYHICSTSSVPTLKNLADQEYDFTTFTEKYISHLAGKPVGVILNGQSVQFIP